MGKARRPSYRYKFSNWCLLSLLVRFIVLSNNYLQIRNIKKTDEGTYRCEGRILARGEINFKDIQVIVNGKENHSSYYLHCYNFGPQYHSL